MVEQSAGKIAPGCPAAVKRAFASYRAATPAERTAALGLCHPAGEPGSALPPAEFGWDELEFYLGEGEEAFEGQIILSYWKEGADAPSFWFIKDGLDEEKC